MTFEDLEREWLMRRRGHRREVAFALAAGVVLVLVLAVVGYYFWPRISGLFI